MTVKWDIGPLSGRELEVMRDALQSFVQARTSAFTPNQREIAQELDWRCMAAKQAAQR